MRRLFLSIAILASLSLIACVDDGTLSFEGEYKVTPPQVVEAPQIADDDHIALAFESDMHEAGLEEQDFIEPEPNEQSEDLLSNAEAFDQLVAYSGATNAQMERDFLQRMNQERQNRGLRTLRVFWDIEDSARRWSRTMSRENKLYHNPNLSGVTRAAYWTRLGENVGRGPTVAGLHTAFMNSPGHRANVVGDYTHVGVGVHQAQGTIWVTFVFLKATRNDLHQSLPPFVDDDFHPFERDIHKIWKAGLTTGCAGGANPRYCPNGNVTRGQMAAFLVRALDLPNTNRNYFDDTSGTFYANAANRLAAAGITHGCGDRRYCGQDPVTRGQMAAFLDRSFNFPNTNRDYFDDDNGRFYEVHANRLRAAGITNGCGPRRYCGEEPVTRGQMAAFLARALGL